MDETQASPGPETSEHNELDAVVVGAGFAGLHMLYRLRGLGLATRVIDAASGVGGTWFWNRYPGARCDIESMEYSYQFSEELQQEWEWSERYPSQPEILEYLNHVADRFELRTHIQFNTRVTAATFDQDAARWTVRTDDGNQISARFCIMATGCLSAQNIPEIEGLGTFEGAWFHTGAWPNEGVDFVGKRVAVIGTGSSGVQIIPIIAQEAEHLTVFQRTACFSVPARNGPLDPDLVAGIKAEYRDFRKRAYQTPFGALFDNRDVSALEASEEESRAEYEARWRKGGLSFLAAYNDLAFNQQANDTAADFIRGKIRQVVDDPEVADKLMPSFAVACKRLSLDTGYYETFNRDNVTLVDINAGSIEKILANCVRANGQDYEVDTIVFATGFDAMTGALTRMDVRGKGGEALADVWADGPRTYLGLTIAGFPNLFTITGPGSPSVYSNMVPMIEQHVNWIADCIGYLVDNGLACIEPTLEAQNAWVDHVNEIADATLFQSCNSWYNGGNIPGKPHVLMPYLGVPPYIAKCNDVVANGYDGFELSA